MKILTFKDTKGREHAINLQYVKCLTFKDEKIRCEMIESQYPDHYDLSPSAIIAAKTDFHCLLAEE